MITIVAKFTGKSASEQQKTSGSRNIFILINIFKKYYQLGNHNNK
jgi:hypothetical protein